MHQTTDKKQHLRRACRHAVALRFSQHLVADHEFAHLGRTQQQIIIVAVARRIIGKRSEIIVEDVNAVIGRV